MVQSEQRDTQSKTHTGITQCNSGQPLQEERDPNNRVVPFSTNLQTNFQTLESPQVELFATSLNTKLPLYISPISDPQAWAVDALNIPWENLVVYAFPPTALLPNVVQKL